MLPKKSSHKFRCICIQPVIGKHFEHIVEHFVQASLLADYRSWFRTQFGFTKSRNINHVICSIINFVRSTSRDSSQKSLLLSLDVEGAFDNVCHSSLINSLMSANFKKSLILIIQNYLTNRFLHFYHNNHHYVKKQTRGVPQGSVLGPLLWNIAIDRLADIGLKSDCLLMYADDLFLLYKFDRRQQPTFVVNHDIAAVQKYLQAYHLNCNLDKSNIISFRSAATSENIATSFGMVKFVRKSTVLGFVIHKSLDAKYHVLKTEMQFDRILDVLTLQRCKIKLLPVKLKKLLLEALFLSRIFCHAGALGLLCDLKSCMRLNRAIARAVKLLFCLPKPTTVDGALVIGRQIPICEALSKICHRWISRYPELSSIFGTVPLHSHTVTDPDTCVIGALFTRSQLLKLDIDENIFRYTFLFLSGSFPCFNNMVNNGTYRCSCGCLLVSIKHVIFECSITVPFLWRDLEFGQRIPDLRIPVFLRSLYAICCALRPHSMYRDHRYQMELRRLVFT